MLFIARPVAVRSTIHPATLLAWVGSAIAAELVIESKLVLVRLLIRAVVVGMAVGEGTAGAISSLLGLVALRLMVMGLLRTRCSMRLRARDGVGRVITGAGSFAKARLQYVISNFEPRLPHRGG